jgi:glycine dehydrogenase
MKFSTRHIGINDDTTRPMLDLLNLDSLDDLVDKSLPKDIHASISPFPALSEQEYEDHITNIGNKNTQTTSFIGQGFYRTYCPSVIRRNILENPSWYTQYTPYQAEISQGRLEALFNFQTVITELTKLPIANASLLDEGNACSEAVFMAFQHNKGKKKTVVICDDLFESSKNVILTRFKYLDIQFQFQSFDALSIPKDCCAIIGQYPNKHGQLNDYTNIFKQAQSSGAVPILATDLFCLTLNKTPKDMLAEIAVGSSQAFGVPLGFGGPSAAFISCKAMYTRLVPGRIIGQSKDVAGAPAYRMALQTREQHIRRERATSNICTAQSLLAIISSFYAIYFGSTGLIEIATRMHTIASFLHNTLGDHNFKLSTNSFFNTITIIASNADELTLLALENSIEWYQKGNYISISIDPCTTHEEIIALCSVFGISITASDIEAYTLPTLPTRSTPFFTQKIFSQYHNETQFLRYMKRLERKDLSLADSLIPLGSCTMKLNATTELLSLSNPQFANIHPLSNSIFTQGYRQALTELEDFLTDFTGLSATCLQPNSGAQGEFSGLMCIRDYFKSIGESQRTIALIPTSAHGTNPASASLCGLTIIQIPCVDTGEISIVDLQETLSKHSDTVAVCMITYPSTFGTFDKNIKQVTALVHKFGAQIYMDGANMNAQIGVTSPAAINADVCHINLHKTFAIPHGGGGPGVGPICVAKHLVPFLPTPNQNTPEANYFSSSFYGSASICLISYGYIKLMGSDGLKKATQVALLSANFIANRLSSYFDVMYRNKEGFVAHELIINCKAFRQKAGVTVEDIAKRLMDYGFHAPTISWPVPDSLMIEPTESENHEDLNRFCLALGKIKSEIEDIQCGKVALEDSPLKNAPHSIQDLQSDWPYNYSFKTAFFPSKTMPIKFWPSTKRIDNAYGDRNLVCSCLPIDIELTHNAK